MPEATPAIKGILSPRCTPRVHMKPVPQTSRSTYIQSWNVFLKRFKRVIKKKQAAPKPADTWNSRGHLELFYFSRRCKAASTALTMKVEQRPTAARSMGT